MAERDQTAIPRRILDRARITSALSRGVREALLTHARMGRSVPQQENGQIIWLTPAEIFARYGFDENGKPKN